jgi:hypothetical protein
MGYRSAYLSENPLYSISSIDLDIRKVLSPNLDTPGHQDYIPNRDVQYYSFPQEIGINEWKQVGIAVSVLGPALILLEDDFHFYVRKPNAAFIEMLHSMKLPTDQEELKKLDDDHRQDDQDRAKYILVGFSCWPKESAPAESSDRMSKWDFDRMNGRAYSGGYRGEHGYYGYQGD